LAALNGVKNLKIGARCSRPELASRIAGRTLLICDIEGAEYEFLNPDKTPGLRECDVLVELHENGGLNFTPGSGADELVRRFSKSHKITRINSVPRSAYSTAITRVSDKLTERELSDCLDERRPSTQVWLWLETLSYKAQPRSGAVTSLSD
jgi:hypothetical protein